MATIEKREVLLKALELTRYASAPFFSKKEGKRDADKNVTYIYPTTEEWWDGLREQIESVQPLIEAALTARPDAQPSRSETASRILGAIHDVAELKPEEGETWESWYAAACELLGSKVGDLLVARDAQADERGAFQSRVQPWMLACFGAEIAADRRERNHRFFEEAAELVQACGMTASEAHQLVEYTWSRPIGEKTQEVGGVMVTLAALCLANGLDMHAAGETELACISDPETMAKIRAKQAAKPKHSPRPGIDGGRTYGTENGRIDGHLACMLPTYQWTDTGPLETGDTP